MSVRNTVQVAFDESCKSLQFEKRRGAWYRRGEDLVTVVDLQKSQYGPQYYINLGLWLIGLEGDAHPKPVACHVRTRLASVVGEREELELKQLLDLESPVPDKERHDRLLAFLTGALQDMLSTTHSVATLRSPAGRSLLKKSGVRGPAVEILALS